MSQLEVAYYDETPIEGKDKSNGKVEVQQAPISSASGLRSAEGAIRTSLVRHSYRSEAGPFLVPFGAYDEWSLRDRYNEAIRIMNTLGASTITCETYGETAASIEGFRAKLLRQSAEATQHTHREQPGFDFRHSGAGSAQPLRSETPPLLCNSASSRRRQQRRRERSDGSGHQHQEQPHAFDRWSTRRPTQGIRLRPRRIHSAVWGNESEYRAGFPPGRKGRW